MARSNLQSYQISCLNNRKITALSILSLTDKENFAKRREEIILTALGLYENKHDKGPPGKKTIIKEKIKSYLLEGLNTSNAEEDSQQLTAGLLNEQISPYEAVGIIKDLYPEMTGKEMKSLWTTLSIVTGLNHLNDKSLEINWEKTTQEDSIEPKIKNLKRSLQEVEREDKTVIKRKYHENYKHLATSIGKDTNWTEVLCNLPSSEAGLLQAMLNSSKDNILKEEATRNVLWPCPSPVELENKRLNNLLETLGNRPTGRQQRYNRILLNKTDKNLPDNLSSLPTPTAIVVTDKEKAFEKKTERLLNLYREAPEKFSKEGDVWSQLFLKFGIISKIDTTKSKEIANTLGELITQALTPDQLNSAQYSHTNIDLSRTLRGTKALINQILESLLRTPKKPADGGLSEAQIIAIYSLYELAGENEKLQDDPLSLSPKPMSKGGSLHPIRKKSQELLKAISDKVVVDAIEVALNSVVEASKIKTLTGLLKNPQNYRELFSQHPYNQIKALKQIASRDLILKEKAPDPTFKKSESELEDIFESNTKNKERDLSKGYGPGKLSALHLASWYKKQQPLDAVIQKMQEQNLPLEPKDLEGNTPLHRSLPNATIKLLAAKANANVKNKDLKTPWETNQYQESKTLIKQEGTKQKILKKVTNSREIEI